MGEGEHVPVISQVFEPGLDGVNHAHFVIEPGQLFGCGSLQRIEVTKQQIIDRGYDKGRCLSSLRPGLWSHASHWQHSLQIGDSLHETQRIKKNIKSQTRLSKKTIRTFVYLYVTRDTTRLTRNK